MPDFDSAALTVFLLWITANVALFVAGLQRWLLGTPGGVWATYAAGTALLPALAVLGIWILELIAPQRDARVEMRRIYLGLTTTWLCSLWLAVVAVACSLREPEPASGTAPRGDESRPNAGEIL